MKSTILFKYKYMINHDYIGKKKKAFGHNNLNWVISDTIRRQNKLTNI